MENFFSSNGGPTKGWGLMALHTMSKGIEGIKKYIGDVRGIKIKNILYFKQRFVGKHYMKNIGWHWKGPILKQQKAPKKTLCAINVNILIDAN